MNQYLIRGLKLPYFGCVREKVKFPSGKHIQFCPVLASLFKYLQNAKPENIPYPLMLGKAGGWHTFTWIGGLCQPVVCYNEGYSIINHSSHIHPTGQSASRKKIFALNVF